MLPKIKIWYFQKKYIVDLDPPKSLSLVVELRMQPPPPFFFVLNGVFRVASLMGLAIPTVYSIM